MADRSQSSDIDRLSEAVRNLLKSLECTICLELMTEPTKTRCGHSFCKSCIGEVLRKRNTNCPLCKTSLNRRSISKDDHLQSCIKKFNRLVIAIETDTCIDILSHSKLPQDTKESCSSDTRQFSRDSTNNKEESSKKERRSSRQLNQDMNWQTDKPSTSRGTMIDRYDSDVKPVTLSRLSRAGDDDDDESDNAFYKTSDMKVRTWLHSFPDKSNTDDWIEKSETPSIADKVRPMNPISDDGKSDELFEVDRDRVDASRRPNREDKERSTDCLERIGEDDNNHDEASSQVNKGARQIGKVIEIDSTEGGLKYNASHARIRARENREKDTRVRSDIGEEISVNQQDNSSSSAHDRLAASAPSCLVAAEQSANWSRVLEFGKEMKRAKKRKVKKLNVSTEKNKKPPRIIENIKLSPNNKYNVAKITADYNKSEKEAGASNQLKSNGREQDAIDKRSDLSGAKASSANTQAKLLDADKTESPSYSTMSTSYLTLEDGRKIGLMNVNNDQMTKIIDLENAAGNSEDRRCEENDVNYRDSLLSPQKKLAAPTPKKLDESVRENREMVRGVSQTSADNLGSSPRLSAEKRTPKPRETGNVHGESSAATSSQLQSSSPNRGRLSLGRKGTGDNKDGHSPLLSQVPLSYRLSISKWHEEDGKGVDSPGPNDRQEQFDRLRAVRRDLNFKNLIHEDQQQTDRRTEPAGALKGIIEVGDNDGNVSGIVRQDKKLRRSFIGESTATKKFSLSRKSTSFEDRSRECRSLVKFLQLGSLIRRRNIQYFFLGRTKRELSMPAEVQITPVYNMQQLESMVNKSEIHITTSANLWNDSENSNHTVIENNCFANNSNTLNRTISKELPAASSICEASATSTPKKDIDSHLNRKSMTTARSSTSANQIRSDKSNDIVTKEGVRSPNRISCANKSANEISHTRSAMSNPIKLLSPDKDSQLKFLAIDSPTSEREELRRASSIKSDDKGNNFSEMKNSRLAPSTLGEAQGSFIEKPHKKRKRMRCASDREIFEKATSGRDDSSHDSASDSSRSTIKLARELSTKARLNRSNASKKRCLSSSSDQEVDVISLFPEKRPKRKWESHSSDSEPEAAMPVTKNLKRRHSDDQCAQHEASIADAATKKCRARQDSEDETISNIQKLVDEYSNKHDGQEKLTKESKDTQNSVKSIRNPSEENAASHQSSRSSNTLKMEKRNKNAKSSQKSSARESDMFESSSLFNSENVEYILSQHPARLNANDTPKKTVDSSNDDIINRVLQIDRSRGNLDTCQPPESAPRNDTANQRATDNRDLLQEKDSFDEIIANVEQPQSDDFIPCTEQSDRNPKRPLAKQKTSGCLAMTDESYGTMQETLNIPPSSTNDMFEYHSPRKVRKPPATDVISRNSDKENVVCSYVSDQRDRKDVTADANAIDKDSRKKIVSKNNNTSREKEKFLEERDTSVQSAGRLRVNNDEAQRATATGNESSSKDDTFEQDSLMNITQHQAQLQMFEEDLFGIAARNRMKTTKILPDDSSQKELRTPKKRKQNTQDKNTELEEHSAGEDDIVENTPEKKMNSGNNVKAIESKECTNITFLSPISNANKQTPSTSVGCPLRNSSKATPNSLYPSSQSTPKIPYNSNRSDLFGECKKTEHIENDSVLLVKPWLVDTKKVENIRRILDDKRDLRFVCTGLSTTQITTVKEFAAKYNASYVNQFDRDVTHVIVRTTGEQNEAHSTLKYLQGIAHRKWVVSYRWIENCIKQNKLLDEVPYEATTVQNDGVNGAGPRNSRLRDKGLFEGFTFMCVEPYNNVSLKQYQDLLLATGAVVVEGIDHLAKMGGMKGIVVQENVYDDKQIDYWYHTAHAALICVDWIVECIGHYKLFKLMPYIIHLSSQELCAIGYHRDLVEEDEEYSDDE
ncbi:uncharacterized protein LOC105831361 [Monomorium pharaonis]|uniref:uncharacterized protein LOC105831361 n=1 Tax=Monomorium pharaonis TaxID=307658 RepID=UPI001746F99E|nr:uncharacterized protein LOC105831361 [Monomorium pharaonis]